MRLVSRTAGPRRPAKGKGAASRYEFTIGRTSLPRPSRLPTTPGTAPRREILCALFLCQRGPFLAQWIASK
jgi:hypothetical protein